MAVYSTLFYRQQGLLGYVGIPVPSGQIWVIRDFQVYSGALLPSVVRLKDGVTGQTIWFYDFGIASNQWADWQGRQVFNSGDTIGIEADTNPADVRLSGYALTP